MIRVFSRQIQKLHSQEGQALVFVAMVGLLLFLFFAMTMNLAEVAHIKIKNQNTADAAALSGAVWQARVLNTVSALNQSILDWWVTMPIASLLTAYTGQICGGLCYLGYDELCLLCIFGLSWEIFADLTMLFSYLITTELQDSVIRSFDREFIQDDLLSVVNLNYAFKPNTAREDIDTEVLLYLHENNGNLFLEEAGGPGVDYVLERGGWCELILGIFNNYCARGLMELPGGGTTWRECMETTYAAIAAGPGGGVNDWYSDTGICLGSTVPSFWEDIEELQRLFPYVLRTFQNHPCCPADYNCCIPANPGEVLPITVGVYRERQPPVLHLWQTNVTRGELDCESPPDSQNWFPCTSAGHFSFASAHAYSPSVAQFYWHLYGLEADGGLEYQTIYPIPLVPAITDWEARLFPLEPGLEQGRQSRYAGRVAYDDIVAQAGERLGSEAEEFLRQNVLLPPSNPPWDFWVDFFLY